MHLVVIELGAALHREMTVMRKCFDIKRAARYIVPCLVVGLILKEYSEFTSCNMRSLLVASGLAAWSSLVLGASIPYSRRPYGAPTVTIKNGTIQGVHSSTYNEDFFLGVPFAQPPTGELRYRLPQSIDKTFNGTLQTTEYAPECYGYGVSASNQ